jgi:hypothetical protein
MAQGFAPWDERGIPRDRGAAAVTMAVPPAGFAPWRERMVLPDGMATSMSRMTDAFGSVFRPWS